MKSQGHKLPKGKKKEGNSHENKPNTRAKSKNPSEVNIRVYVYKNIRRNRSSANLLSCAHIHIHIHIYTNPLMRTKTYVTTCRIVVVRNKLYSPQKKKKTLNSHANISVPRALFSFFLSLTRW